MSDPPGTQWLRGVTQQMRGPAKASPLFTVGQPKGLRTAGNLDLNTRPVVRNPDGSVSTVRTITVTDPRGAWLLPTVVGGQVVPNEAAIAHWRATGENLGLFDTEENADAYAQALHEQQMQMYVPAR